MRRLCLPCLLATVSAGAEFAGAGNKASAAHEHLREGRLARLQFDRAGALRHFSAAFELAPDDPAVLREYAFATPARSLESALNQRLLRLPNSPEHWKSDAQARAEVLRRLGGRAVNELKSPYERHEIRMPVVYSRDDRTIGWVLSVSINGERPLRLMFDTGSRGILVSRGDAARLGLEKLGGSIVGGFGDRASRRGEFLLAKSVRTGGLEFGNVIVEAVDHDLPPEVDGLAGPDLFRQFQLALDGRRRILKLEPFPDTDPQDGAGERPWTWHERSGSGHSLLQAGHLLVAPVLTEGREALFVIDSGAAFSLVQARQGTISAGDVSLRGLSGFAAASRILQPLRLQLGSHRALVRELVSADLSPISDRYGIPIAGFLGFPVLSRVTTRIDLRSGSLTISE
ncbi:MAG: retropepsin-like aspartic protease [Bryobacteraceae bacterium]